MSTAEPITLRAGGLVAGGDALARLDDGRVAFVRGALPGELVTTSIRDRARDFARLDLVDVLEPSPSRLVPPCAYRRAGCGGCGWMHFDPAAQLDAKVAIVAESLRRIGRFDPAEVEAAVVAGASVEPVGYRTTIRLVGLPGGGVGYREEGSAAAVAIDGCLVAHHNLAAILPEIDVDPGVELTLRTSDSTGAITARWTDPNARRRDRGRRGRSAGRRSASAPPVRGLPSRAHVGDRAFLVERVAGRELRVSARSFFQSGPQAAELLVDAVARAAPELATAGHAVDLYGGVGLFAATVMADAARVTLVESEASACNDAAVNLSARRVGGDSSVRIVEGEARSWRADPVDGPVDVVVADPARPGLAGPGSDAVARCAAPVVVLVSCDPASLARDVRLLAQEGYRAERVEVLDVVPQTPHIECVTRLVRDDDRGSSK